MTQPYSPAQTPSVATGTIGRYQAFRTRRFLDQEHKTSAMLPRWRSQKRRRIVVAALLTTFAFMFGVGVVCAFEVRWAAVLWLPACAAFLPLWTTLQIVSGRQGDAPADTLDEWEVEQRNQARSIGLTVTQALVFIPVCYLIIGATITNGTNESMAYAGGLMTLTTLLVGGCTPAMILGWTRPNADPE